MSVPATAFSATYDANNRLTGLNGSTPTYDVNGNTLSDGKHSGIGREWGREGLEGFLETKSIAVGV